MIYTLKPEEFHNVKPLFPSLEDHPVINGVINKNNLGSVFVDHPFSPKTAFIWAKNEIFFLVGDIRNQRFNEELEPFIASNIRTEALENGEDYFNLEIFPNHEWDESIASIFKYVKLSQGARVPFIFHKDWYKRCEMKINDGYKVMQIDDSVIEQDSENVIRDEILKFWDSLEMFFEKGFGFVVVKGSEVIGSCISVFVSKNEYEIGINTYKTEHRGKGLATAMARKFIDECLQRGGTPHWTTEDFRKDSVAIAKKVGFEQLENYPVFYLPFKEFVL
ncbi:GNAT family N-acetyltransferase [Ferdinandcohnia quinoae]|uniref:GNAT family N-acetyltransferase n=1 Tax=Fredinandcohnia quinoae TaxID=2918902 RepID=A0AAW5E7G0_9BACI|nr:GNAT family N-acetyltransferase [Fredinandcohnia sp. SECRCQ15]MCH1625941.1 GNAT family N-acetyltransferase [Fredinandcohnia sp. SECRCQ15]